MTTKRRKFNSELQTDSSKRNQSDTKKNNDISAENDTWTSESVLIVSSLLLVRLLSAAWGIINDCDEVYNYWEPLHLFLHGEGFQTWEYSPVYAIRSYFYIYLHYIPALLFTTLGQSKIAVFTSVRVFLGIFCLLGEFYAYRAISKNINRSTGRFFIFFTIFSSGVFQASTAFVPSSFCMALCFYILGAYLNQNWKFGIFCVAFSTLVGWPFSAILGLSIVIQMLIVKQLFIRFIKISLVSGLSVGLVQFLIDSYHFGKPVIAPLNIVIYNVLTGPGPSLYGEEPLSYYFKNLIVNWNIAAAAAVVGFLFSLIFTTDRQNEKGAGKQSPPIIWLSATACLWFSIFAKQPHKEERFLFPIYPFIALFTALACYHVNRISFKSYRIGELGSSIFAVVFAILSISRAYSIHINYGSHIEVYKILSDELSTSNHSDMINQETIRVCVGKEWHRFPSSFFIPKYDSSGKKVEMCFLQSEFRGILPKSFEKAATLLEKTRHEPSAMNDLNKEEVSRYVDLASCNFVIDVDMPSTSREPDFRTMTSSWKVISSKPFIDVSRSTGLFGFLRAFYVPFYSEKANVMTTYSLYKKRV